MFLFLLPFSSCSKKNLESSKPVVLCTTFSVYDWCRNILAGTENFELQLLNSKGSDMHSFQPSVQDMARLSSADFLFYIGGESEKWIEDVVAEKKNKNQFLISLLELLGEDRKLESSEGIMEKEEPLTEAEQSRSYAPSSEESEKPEYDEHVWLSLKNAVSYCIIFCGIFSEADRENSATYFENFTVYGKQIDTLYCKFRDAFNENTILLFADRFPFRYFTDDYKVKYYAAFPGCSAETEASFSTVINLADIVRENKLDTVYVLENSKGKMAERIIDTAGTDTCVKVLDSIQSVSLSDIDSGKTYLSIMQKNFETIFGNGA